MGQVDKLLVCLGGHFHLGLKSINKQTIWRKTLEIISLVEDLASSEKKNNYFAHTRRIYFILYIQVMK